MRTLLIALVTLGLGFTAQANRFKANSQFNIRMADLSNYTVVFNNTTYFATEWVKIYNVPPGKHYLRIEETVQSQRGRMHATGSRLIYEGWVTVPAASKVNTRVNFNRYFAVTRIDRMVCGKPYQGYGHNQPGNYGPYQGQPQGGYNQNQNDYNDYGYDNNDPNTYQYGDQNPAQNPNGYGNGNSGQDPNGGGVYDDGTYGTSQLKAKPVTKPMSTNQKIQKAK